MKSAGKARNNGLYRHIRTSKEIIRNLLNDCYKNKKALIFIGKIKTNLAMVDKNDTISKGFTEFHSKMKL